jgi:hypothetical protein
VAAPHDEIELRPVGATRIAQDVAPMVPLQAEAARVVPLGIHESPDPGEKVRDLAAIANETIA